MNQLIHNSYWVQKNPLHAKYPILTGTHETEVLVVGAGITGLTMALELAKRGRRVAVCESSVVGAGTTSGSSGHLDAHPEMGPRKLLDKLGLELAREYVAMRQRAIERIKAIAGGECDCVPIAAYQYSERMSDERSLRDNMEAAIQIGLRASWADIVPIPRAKLGYKIEGMARIDTALYLQQLATIAVQQGVEIFENSLVKLSGDENAKTFQAGEGEVHCEQVVSAAHSNFTPVLHIYAATPAYQSYVLTARVSDAFPDSLFWDSSDPYFYVRRARTDDDRLIMVGGCDHRTGAGDEVAATQRLERWVRDRFHVTVVSAQWSAELFEPTDGLPMIGKAFGDNMWVVAGLSGVGLTQGTAAGTLLADLMAGLAVPLAESFSPARYGLTQPLHWLREQAASVIDVSERILPATAVNLSALLPRQGAVGTVDGKHVAVCRDHSGCLHQSSPICSHMGGVVHWNEAEQTWDCPVHGGRFAASGERIYGPPRDPLGSA